MARRSGIFLVKTDWWYVERCVWLVAGIDILSSTILAIFQPDWTFSIMIVGLCSILVALTGFCIIGNILFLLGFTPLLRERARPGIKSRLYFMQTDEWYLERYIYLFVGINLSVSSMLARYHNPYWLFFTGFVGTATIIFAFTGFCIMANFLYRIGATPRMCRYL
ncbi:MAG: DUF2892 domain-containing protein [Thermodesulfovibrionales bacterium]|nr:DUF2892 domain-containing protein [Thermodesulfovibrionales bacterium]